jgi:hypothetical protein
MICRLMMRVRFRQLVLGPELQRFITRLSSYNLLCTHSSGLFTSYVNQSNSVSEASRGRNRNHNHSSAKCEVLIHGPLFRLFLEMFTDAKASQFSLWRSILNVINIVLSSGSRDLLANAQDVKSLRPGDVGLSFLLSRFA